MNEISWKYGIAAVLGGSAFGLSYWYMLLPPNVSVFGRRMMRLIIVAAVAIAVGLSLTGCGATRHATIGDTSVTMEPTDVSMGFWGSLIEPGIERRTGQLADAAWQRQQGALYHERALEAARETRVIAPQNQARFEFATMQGTEIEPLPEYSGQEFSRYEEDFSDGDADLTKPVIQSKVMELPRAGEPGAYPVAFTNSGRSSRTFEFWRSGGWGKATRYSVTVAGGETATKHLQPGDYWVEMFSERGRQERFPRDRSRISSRSSSRYRDPYRDYRRSLTVGSTPSFIADNGEQYFGRIRSGY